MLSCYAMLSYIYIDFCKKGSVKTTKYGVFACSDHMHVLYVEITRIPLRQIDFKLVSIVECFCRRGVWKQLWRLYKFPWLKPICFSEYLKPFLELWNALKISSSAAKHQSRCLLFPDWMHSLVSSNQHEVLTAWLRRSFQKATNASRSSFSKWKLLVTVLFFSNR